MYISVHFVGIMVAVVVTAVLTSWFVGSIRGRLTDRLPHQVAQSPPQDPAGNSAVLHTPLRADRTQAITGPSRFAAASSLQRLLPHLAAVELAGRQARWNTGGPGAITIHERLRALVSDTTTWTERVADRLVQLGFTADARPTTLSSAGTQLRRGRLSAHEAAETIAALVDRTCSVSLDAVEALELADRDGFGLAAEILVGLRRHRDGLSASHEDAAGTATPRSRQTQSCTSQESRSTSHRERAA